MIKILWVSRHPILQSQEEALKGLFGEIRITPHFEKFTNADYLLDLMGLGGYHEMVFVGPLSVLKEIIERGIHPLFAKMDLVKNGEEAEVRVWDRGYRFRKFLRVKDVHVEFEEVNP